MNEKNKIPSLNGGAHLSRIPYKLNHLPYKPIITLAVDKSTQSIIGFSIHEANVAKNVQTHTRQLKATSINCVRNAIAYHFAGIPCYLIDDGSPELSNTRYVKAFKELSLHPKLAWDNTVVGSIKIKHIVEDIFVTLSLPLRRHPRPSPKNPPLG
jgi:hypothetical protein